jgi:hypothetical protein
MLRGINCQRTGELDVAMAAITAKAVERLALSPARA